MQLFTKSGLIPSAGFPGITGSDHVASAVRQAMPAALWVIAGLVLLHAAYFLWIGLSSPLLDLHSFRQTQTALSAYWMLQDGLKLDYETPLLGYPWSIPLEFPIYQGLVATTSTFGLSIEASGRLWSFAFFAACIWPLHIISRTLVLPRYVLPATAILLSSSPLYIYWSRTVMIESCALFFSLVWLALIIRSVARRSIVDLSGAVIVGVLAVLAKSTTFPAFGLLGGLWAISDSTGVFRSREYKELLRRSVFFLLGCIIPISAGYGWLLHTDAIKSLNPLASSLISGNLHNWIYGTWDQLFSLFFLKALFFSIANVFGYAWSVVAIALYVAFKYRRDRYLGYAIAAAFCFLVPFLVFTNLHIVHSYYQYANAIFLIIAAIMALTSIAEAGRPVAALMTGLTISAGQILFFHSTYAPFVEDDYTKYDTYQIALQAKRVIPPSQGILVIGEDAQSVVFYSERRGVALTYLESRDLIERLLRNPDAFFGDKPLGGIVYCGAQPFLMKDSPVMVDFIAGRTELGMAGACKLLSASR